jgi:aminopeptidase N
MTSTRRVARSLAGAAVACALLVPGVPAAQAVVPTDGEPGIGDAYWPLDGNGGLDVASYTIKNRYAFDTGRLAGRTRVELTATTELRSFSLDFLLPVRSVTVDGVRATVHHDGHELRITPAGALPAGSRHTVVVSYAGRPRRERYVGERNWLANRREVVAMNEPHMAPWWFPANDHPADKALMDISVTVPRGKEVVANGRLREHRTGDRTTTWRWRADEPMTTYLAFFAAGDFTLAKGRHRGLPWLVAVSEQLSPPEQRLSMRLMKRTPEIVADLEEDLGPYPFSVTGGLTTGLSPGFALENQTRPTYPSVGDYPQLVVHELAHQWFGDHVAVERWRDIWLNEGFATFMEWRWNENRGGTSGARTLKTSWAQQSDSFWQVVIGDPGPERVFDPAVYDRGAMTLQALRNRVGDEAFWRIIRAWLDEQGGGNGSSTEFEATAARVSGQDLSGFFTAWLRTPARPAATADNGLG